MRWEYKTSNMPPLVRVNLYDSGKAAIINLDLVNMMTDEDSHTTAYGRVRIHYDVDSYEDIRGTVDQIWTGLNSPRA